MVPISLANVVEFSLKVSCNVNVKFLLCKPAGWRASQTQLIQQIHLLLIQMKKQAETERRRQTKGYCTHRACSDEVDVVVGIIVFLKLHSSHGSESCTNTQHTTHCSHRSECCTHTTHTSLQPWVWMLYTHNTQLTAAMGLNVVHTQHTTHCSHRSECCTHTTHTSLQPWVWMLYTHNTQLTAAMGLNVVHTRNTQLTAAIDLNAVHTQHTTHCSHGSECCTHTTHTSL